MTKAVPALSVYQIMPIQHKWDDGAVARRALERDGPRDRDRGGRESERREDGSTHPPPGATLQTLPPTSSVM